MPRHANSTNRRPRAFVWCKTLVKDGQSQLFCASLRKPHATRPKHFRLWRCPRKTNLTSVVAETFAWFLHFILDFLNWWPSKSFPAKIYECTLHQHAEQKIWQHRPFFHGSTLFHYTSILHAFSKQVLLQKTKLHPKCKNRIPTKTCRNESGNVGCEIFRFLLLKNRFHEVYFRWYLAHVNP